MPVVFSTTTTHNYKNAAGTTVAGNALIGRYEAPLRMVIQSESDLCTKNDRFVETLYNTMKSSRYAEAFLLQKEFDIFSVVAEGSAAPSVTTAEAMSKILYHFQFMNQFTVTANMMEDAQVGQAAMAARNFTRSYYKTRNLLASRALTSATAATMSFAGGTFDLTTADGQPLFHKSHVWGGVNTQGNRHYVKLAANALPDAATVEAALTAAAEKVRNMKDENGYATGYVADTVMIPVNLPGFESVVRKVLGSQYAVNAAGALSGSINTQYGAMTLIVNPYWSVDTTQKSYPMIVFSSEANKALCGGVFLDRIPLTVSSRVDENTGNFIFTGRARMSVGFINYKFADLFEFNEKDETKLFDDTTISGNTVAEAVTV